MEREADEVQKHLKQALHNYEFFCEVHSKLPKAFYDWKITILFYTALHLIRAIATERDLDPGNNHVDLKNAIHPEKSSRGVANYCYYAYTNLMTLSENSRYSGFLSPTKRTEHLRSEFDKAQDALKKVDSYMKSKGYKSILTIQEQFDFDE